ncbi:hypothetical protein ACFX2C_011226 [Malus domestica]
MIGSREKLCKLSQWKVDQRVLGALEGTGLDNLYTLATIVGRNAHDNSMIDALVRHYDVRDRCFKINNQNLFFGLEDVLLITGLPVEGTPVIKSTTNIHALENLLGGVPESELKDKSNAVNLSWLQKEFEHVPENVDADRFSCHVRGFVLYILGTVMVPSLDHVHVNLGYLGCMSEIGEIKKYAWGVALLSHVHYSLESHHKRRKNAIGSHLFFLMVWALEHIPAFVTEFFGNELDTYPSEFPLSCAWGKLFHNVLSNRHKVRDFNRHLENLWENENSVTWQPYMRLADNFLPEEIRGQRRMGSCRVILIHPIHRCPLIFHRPDLCPRKLGFREADVTACSPMLSDRTRFRSWKLHLEEWEKLETCFVRNRLDQQETNLREGGTKSGGFENIERIHITVQEWSEAEITATAAAALSASATQVVERAANLDVPSASIPVPSASIPVPSTSAPQDVPEPGAHVPFASATQDVAEQVAPPPVVDSSSSFIKNSESKDNPLLSPSPPKIPIVWPPDGKLSLEWVRNLMSTMDWASRNLDPMKFPDVFPMEVFDSLVISASNILHKEANCVLIDRLGSESTVVVVGDIHGQLHDLLFLLNDAGFPSENRLFVFNGDYVDRGAWGLETFLILLAWKVFLPKSVYLLRGNHESKYCTSVYGFEKEVLTKYGDKGKDVYRQCLWCFKRLPLTSIIGNYVYTAHGGLFRSMAAYPKRSKGKKRRRIAFDPELSSPLSLGTFEELKKAQRSVLDPSCEGSNLIPGDVLWSDPSMDPGLSLNTERGIGLLWGPDCTEDFLKKSQLKLIIRTHEGPDARDKRQRPGLEGMDNGFTIDHIVESGKLITLFSAPDYPQFQGTGDRCRNKGAYIVLEPPNFDNPVFHSFEAVTPRPQANPFNDFEEVADSDQELDFASMQTSP